MTTRDDLTCPMFGDVCRHCSPTIEVRPYTKIERDSRTGLYVQKGIGKNFVDLGLYCNNIGAYVNDLHYCPARWALHRGVVKPKKEVKKRILAMSPTTKGQKNKRPQKIKRLLPVKPKKKPLSDSQQKLFKGLR